MLSTGGLAEKKTFCYNYGNPRKNTSRGHLIYIQTMSEDEVIEDEMIDLEDEADFADDGIDLGDDDLLSEDAVSAFSSREIE